MFRLLTLFLFLGLMPGLVFGLRAEAFGKDGVKNSVTGGGEEVTMDTIRLKPVAVYGMTAMRSTDLVLDTADLEPFRLLGLDDLLQYGSGMAIKDYGPGQLATAGYRGGPARHTILRWNGMRINSPMHGTVDLSTIPIAGLTSVRLAGGTAASAQIGSALGGLIDLETNTPSSGQGISGEVRGGGGSFGAWQGEGQLAYQSKRWASRSLFGYAMADNDFTVRHPVIPEFRMPSSDWNRWYALQDFSGLAGSNGFWSASFSGTGTRRNIPPGLMVSNQQESQQDRMLLGAAQYRFQPGHWDLGFRIGLLDEQIFYSNQVADIASDGPGSWLPDGVGMANWRCAENKHILLLMRMIWYSGSNGLSPVFNGRQTPIGAFAWMSYRIVTQRNGCLCSPSFALFIKTAKHSPMGTNGSGRRERELPDIMPGPR